MEETNTAQAGNESQSTKTEKTFTQEEVNGFFNKRYGELMAKVKEFEEKAKKYDEMEEASKTELQKAQERAEKLEAQLKEKESEEAIREIKKKVADEMKVPADLLTGNTEEECRTQAQAIMSFATSQGYPTVRDAGESNPTNKKSTRDAFKEWADSNFN